MEGAAPFTRRKSEAAKLVGSFQELNERLSAFERLQQLKKMVLEGKLKQDVFEEMYRINAEKLVDPRRRKSKRFEMNNLSVLDDFSVRHRTQQPSSVPDLSAVNQAKIKRGTLFFDRIVLRSSSAFGSTRETILIGTEQMTLIFYDDDVKRVDLAYENRRSEQFVFESEVEKLMFVEALEKALDTAARSSTSKDEPVILGRPNRTNSQIKKEFDARKSACTMLEMMTPSSEPALSTSVSNKDDMHHVSFRSNVDANSVYTDDVREYDEDDDDDLLDANNATSAHEAEEKEEEDARGSHEMSSPITIKAAISTASLNSADLSFSDSFSSVSIMSPESTASLIYSRKSSTSSIDIPSASPDPERARLIERLEDAKLSRTAAERDLEAKKAIALETRKFEEEEQKQLHRIKAEEDVTVKNALKAREEDVSAAKNLADCVAAEIAAINALDPDDVLSASTNRAGDDAGGSTEVFMSNNLRNLIGRPPASQQNETMSAYAKLQFDLQQARKALVLARTKVQKTAEARRGMELARREARKAVSAQLTKCSMAQREITRAESAVLSAKAVLTERDEQVAHYEQCLLIIDEHRKQREAAASPRMAPQRSFVEIGVPTDNKIAWMEESIIT